MKRTYVVERQFQFAADHPTHPGCCVPIRSRVEAESAAEAQADANTATEMALETLGGVGKGEWLDDATVSYELEKGGN